MSFSDCIVYADESGDHSLTNINPQNPVFVLALCIFQKEEYQQVVVPSMLDLKFRFWGHDCPILHNYEIRKAKGEFSILQHPVVRTEFLEGLNNLIQVAPFTIIAAAIDKQEHVKRYRSPANPYEIALAFCMERLAKWLDEKKQQTGTTHLIVEKRGKAEDEALELEFRRIADGRNRIGKMPYLDIKFMDKKHNSTGLQMADLVAYPIARYVISPQQPNRAFDILKPKFRRSAAGKTKGYGLKIFP